MLGFQSPEVIQALGANVIFDDNAGTMYVCMLDSSKIDKSPSALALEKQPIWQIKRVQETTDNGITITTITYPKGRKTFDNVLENYESLIYSYAI